MKQQPDLALEIKGLRHQFGSLQVLRGLDLEVRGPGVFGFLGVNGAGKSTTMRLLVGFLEIQQGTLKIWGRDVAGGGPAVRMDLGFLPQSPAFPPWLTGLELLEITGELGGLDRSLARRRARELIARLGLDHARARRIKGWSGGMRQRLGLAQALVTDAPLLLLDEPISALDPPGRVEVLELIEELGSTKTILMSSHVLGDVERICGHVAVLHHGRVLDHGPTRDLLGRHLRPVYRMRTEGSPEAHLELERRLRDDPDMVGVVHEPQAAGWEWTIQTRSPRWRARVGELLAGTGLSLARFQDEADLERVFLDMVGPSPSPVPEEHP